MADTQVITLGGGCFWCVEAVMKDLKGVHSVVSGYMGGHKDNPTYQEVCTGRTGHVEVAQVTFDPDVIPVSDVLRVFFAIHDPTQVDGQGNDIGPQYRSAVFYHQDDHSTAAEQAKVASAEIWDGRPVTEILPAETFWKAEDYHQDYFANNGSQPYCAVVVAPKVIKARKAFAPLMREGVTA